MKARPEETDDSGSTKCDYRRILVARAQRRRPKGVRAREASALETIRLVLPKSKTRLLVGFFGFVGVGLDENRCSTKATKGAFGPPQQSAGARRVQSPEAMAIADNPPGPNS